jgi:hypothetical protein
VWHLSSCFRKKFALIENCYALIHHGKLKHLKKSRISPKQTVPQRGTVISLFRATWGHVPAPLIGPKHEVIMLEHLPLVQNKEKQEVPLLLVQTDICNSAFIIGSDQELHLICHWSGQQQPADSIG